MKVEPSKPPTFDKIAPVVKPQPPPPQPSSTLSLSLLHSLQEIRRRLELAESGLTSHLHVHLGDNSVHECSVHIQQLEVCNFILYRSV